MDVVETQRTMGRRSRIDSSKDSYNLRNDIPMSRTKIEMDIISSSRSSANGVTEVSNRGRSTMKERLTRTLRRRKRRALSAPAKPDRYKLLEDHYNIDRNERVVLPGVPKHEEDFARDLHDYFNLMVLVPVVALNVMNWNWDLIFGGLGKKSIPDAWTGEWFDAFFWVTVAYFVIDMLWIIIFPSAVKSPATIVQHHIATLLYIIIPYKRPELRYCMGACMTVEVNTWFLIARRIFNKEGFPPWIIDLPPFFSLRIKLISVFFYITWISIRCLLYPALAWHFFQIWLQWSARVGTKANLIAFVLPLHTVFCFLNMKWTYALIMSKLRYWRKKGKGRQPVSKGL